MVSAINVTHTQHMFVCFVLFCFVLFCFGIQMQAAHEGEVGCYAVKYQNVCMHILLSVKTVLEVVLGPG